MSDQTLVNEKASLDEELAEAGQDNKSAVLAGPLAAFGAVRYALGGDEVWVIGRLPGKPPATEVRAARRPRRA